MVDDLNGDGRLDLASADWFGSSISVLFGDGTGKFAQAIPYNGGNYPGGIA